MSTKSLAEHLKDVMLETGETIAWAGDPDLMLTAYHRRENGKVEHPLSKIQSMLSACRNSKIFKHDGYIRATDSAGRREILHPKFVLVEQKTV